ncbi:MAG: energy transducer TonB [Verrucomicrobiaceae bacterium]|nr:energy transducer TonB [Verrucomicrobiaceae bacterium]
MSLHSSWQDSLAHDSRRHRQAIRQDKAASKAKLKLVTPMKVEAPVVVPSDYFRDHDVLEPPKKRIEFAIFGIAAIGIHLVAAWTLAHLPPSQIIAPPKPEPVEIVFSTPPPPPPPPKIEPPKPVVQKIVKAPTIPVVQNVVPQTVSDTTNVVAVQEGPPPAPVVSEKVTAARADASYLNNPPPTYPAVALRQGWQGTVHLRVLVQPDGRPATITLEKSSGKKVLDDAALAAVQGWKFVPAKRGDDPIEGWVSFPIEFNLET